jgi:hypothetical protein
VAGRVTLHGRKGRLPALGKESVAGLREMRLVFCGNAKERTERIGRPVTRAWPSTEGTRARQSRAQVAATT